MRKRRLDETASAEPQLRADLVSKASDRRVSFRSRAGQEMEDVRHLQHDLDRHIDAGFTRELGQLAAVVEQRLIGAVWMYIGGRPASSA